MQNDSSGAPARYHCFRCRSGSIHVVCGNVVLMLTPDQFLAFAQGVAEMRQEIWEEVNVSPALTYPDSAVM